MSGYILSPFREYEHRGRLRLDIATGRLLATGKTGRKYRGRIRRSQAVADRLCRYCRTNDGTTIDHATPLALGGDDSESNLYLVCGACNAFKRDQTLSMLRDRLRVMLAAVEKLCAAHGC